MARTCRSLTDSQGLVEKTVSCCDSIFKLVQRDKDVAQAEYEKKHHEEGH